MFYADNRKSFATLLYSQCFRYGLPSMCQQLLLSNYLPNLKSLTPLITKIIMKGDTKGQQWVGLG